jgi:acylphosphatase
MTEGQAAKRVRVVVHGRVQGVFFRGSTEEEAALAGVAGWVRNRADGAVEAVFEGSAAAVAHMVEFVHQGPRWAQVSRVEVVDESPEGLSGFGVRR